MCDARCEMYVMQCNVYRVLCYVMYGVSVLCSLTLEINSGTELLELRPLLTA